MSEKVLKPGDKGYTYPKEVVEISGGVKFTNINHPDRAASDNANYDNGGAGQNGGLATRNSTVIAERKTIQIEDPTWMDAPMRLPDDYGFDMSAEKLQSLTEGGFGNMSLVFQQKKFYEMNLEEINGRRVAQGLPETTVEALLEASAKYRKSTRDHSIHDIVPGLVADGRTEAEAYDENGRYKPKAPAAEAEKHEGDAHSSEGAGVAGPSSAGEQH